MVSEVDDLAVGIGMLTFVLAPFVLPCSALVALTMAVLMIPALGIALLVAPFLLARRCWCSRDRRSAANRLLPASARRTRATREGPTSWCCEDGRMTDRERLLDELRPVAFQIAYRMLGSASEAEDIVQGPCSACTRALEDGEQIPVAPRLRGDRHDSAGDQRAALRARPPRTLRRRVAARADHHRRPR